MFRRPFHKKFLHMGLPLLCKSFLRAFLVMAWCVDQEEVSWLLMVLYWDLIVKIPFLVPPHLTGGGLLLGEIWKFMMALIWVAEKVCSRIYGFHLLVRGIMRLVT